MEERSSKGRKCAGIPIYEDDSNDLSDLGLSVSSSSNNNAEDISNGENTEDIPPDKPTAADASSSNQKSDLLDSVPNVNVSCTEPKMRTRTIQPSKSQPSLYTPRRNSMNIEQKINECTSNSQSSTCSKKPIVLPKIDINERKHLFENGKSNEEDSKLRKSVSSGNISKTKSIKDRLSMFGKAEEPVNPKVDKMFLPKVSVKERLSSIERQNSAEIPFNAKSVEDFKSSQIIKQGLSICRSDSSKNNESPSTAPIMDNEFNKAQRKEEDTRQERRMNGAESETNSASHGNYYDEQSISHPEYSEPKIKPADPGAESQPENIYNIDGSEKCSSSDDEYRNICTKHFRHRSLDSLNSDSKFDSSPFARVQSFEELDFRDRGNYPASSLSGDTDREDSGIHTADVSSCVSQSDDCDTMSMGDVDMHHLEATNLSVIPEVQQEPVVTIACQYNTMSSKLIDLEIENHTLNATESNAPVNELKEELVERDNSVFDHAENFPVQSNCDNPQLELSSSSVSSVITETETTSMKLAEISASNEIANECQDSSPTEKPVLNTEPKEALIDVDVPRQSSESSTLFTSDLIVPHLDFHLDYPQVTREPPKEPPPPPPGLSDGESEDDTLSQETRSDTSKTSSLKRNDSTKRLKREIQLKRSSFLGIDGSNAEDYLEAELRVKTPVDVVGLLANELQYRYTDYQFAYEKARNNNNNNEDYGYEKIAPAPEKYFYGNLVEDKSIAYLHRQSVCSGDSGVASPSSTPQPQLEQEFNFNQQEHFQPNNQQRPDDFSTFNNTNTKHHNVSNNNNYNVNQTKNHEIIPIKEENFTKDSSYQQNSKYYNEQNNRSQHIVERTQNMYNNYNGDHKTTNGNHTQNEYYPSQQSVDYNDQNNKVNKFNDNGVHYNDIRDNSVKNAPVNHPDRQIYNQYNQIEYKNNNHGDVYKQDYYNNSKDVYQNAEMYLQKDYSNQSGHQEYFPEKYPQHSNNYNGELEHKKFNNHQYKGDHLVNGNDYYHNNYNEIECPNIMRRSLQDITHKSIALYENTSTFQDDYREPHALKEMSRQQKAIPAGGRSMPNLKDIKYRSSSQQPIPSQSAQRRPSPPDPYSSSSRIPKSSSNENGAQVKRKPKQSSLYNYNQHWLIQEAEHRRIIEQQQRKSMPLQTTSTKLTNEVKSNNVNINRTNIAQNNKNWSNATNNSNNGKDKGLPDAIIENLTRRVQHKLSTPLRRPDEYESKVQVPVQGIPATNLQAVPNSNSFQYFNRDKMLSVSGKNKCSFCSEELGRGAAMIIESLHLFYHIHCFKCSVCCIQLGDGLMGTDVRVRNNKLHCQNCYSNDDGVKFSCV